MSTVTPYEIAVIPESAPEPRRNKAPLLARIRAKLLPFYLRHFGVTALGKQWLQACLPSLEIKHGSRCIIRNGCALGPGVKIIAINGGTIDIGENVYLNGGTLFAQTRIAIGAHSMLSDCHVADDTFHAVSPASPRRGEAVTIGRNVWINPGARICAGVTIGDHSVIGAGAVVTRDIPARSFAAGVPARVVSTFECADNWVRQ